MAIKFKHGQFFFQVLRYSCASKALDAYPFVGYVNQCICLSEKQKRAMVTLLLEDKDVLQSFVNNYQTDKTEEYILSFFNLIVVPKLNRMFAILSMLFIS